MTRASYYILLFISFFSFPLSLFSQEKDKPQKIWIKYKLEDSKLARDVEYAYVDSAIYIIKSIDKDRIIEVNSLKTNSSKLFIATPHFKKLIPSSALDSLGNRLMPLFNRVVLDSIDESYSLHVDKKDQQEILGIPCYKVVINYMNGDESTKLYVTDSFSHLPIKHQYHQSYPELPGFPLQIEVTPLHRTKMFTAYALKTDFTLEDLQLPDESEFEVIDMRLFDVQYQDATGMSLIEGFKIIFQMLKDEINSRD